MQWSLSAIGTYEGCGLKARFKYVERKEDKRSASANRGVDHHKSVEDFLLSKSTSLPAELSHYHSWFEGIKKYEIYPEHIITLNDRWEKVASDSEKRWYKGVLDLLIVRRNSKRNEQDVSTGRTGGHGGENAIGNEAEGRDKELVAAVQEPEELIIYDWKTGKIYPEHDDQKALYSVAAFSEYPSVHQVRAIHVYFDLGQIRQKTFHKDEMHELRNKWNVRAGKYLEALKNPDGMIANPGYHCRWCSFSASKGGPCRF